MWKGAIIAILALGALLHASAGARAAQDDVAVYKKAVERASANGSRVSGRRRKRPGFRERLSTPMLKV